MKRLIVYFHYDPLGQIDTACRVAVDAMAWSVLPRQSPTRSKKDL